MRSASDTSGERRQGYCLLLIVLATALRPGVLPAQRPRFDAAQLGCVRFDVRVQTSVTTELQGRRRTEEIQRHGLLTLRGTPADSGIAIEAWWDSLTLSRRADDATLTPDAGGMLGGRYRGLLTPEGRFTRTAAPWVPDEVAEVSDLAIALDDLFPDLLGSRVRPLADSGGIHRYRLTSARENDAPAAGDRPFAVHESESSDGVVGWDREGLRSWVRTIRSETQVKQPPGRTFRSQMTQQVTLQRVEWCGSGAAGGTASGVHPPRER